MRGWTSALVVAVLIVFVIFINMQVRQYGINSCRDRGGTPVTRSWLSDEPWDVSCINVP